MAGSTARTIVEDLKQTRPFASLGQEAYVTLLRTADDARRLGASVLEDSDITLQQYNVLRILRGAGPEGLPTLAIGERMVERTPGVTRLIDRMVDRSWVVRERCKKDRRRVWCRITDEGLELLDALDGPIRRVDSVIGDALSDDEMRALVSLLDRIRAQVSSDIG